MPLSLTNTEKPLGNSNRIYIRPVDVTKPFYTDRKYNGVMLQKQEVLPFKNMFAPPLSSRSVLFSKPSTYSLSESFSAYIEQLLFNAFDTDPPIKSVKIIKSNSPKNWIKHKIK